MPNQYDPEQVQRLIDTIDKLSADLEKHKVELRKTDRRTHSIRIWSYVAVLVGALGLIVGGIGITVGSKANSTAKDVAAITADRNQDVIASRISGCIQFNFQRAELRVAVKSSLLALVPPGQPLTATQQAVIERYNAEVDAGLPYRDCSPDGITAYFAAPPEDPNKPK